jgi:NAD(P)-dependent dehydrogenase (short-subunit alcohol dehydrogenase family)
VTASELFRPGLLDGQVVAVVCGGALAKASVEGCAELGADVVALGPGADPDGAVDLLDEAAVGQAFAAAAARHGGLHTVVVDAAGLFAAPPPAGLDPLRGAVDPAWIAARAAASAAMLAAPEGGKLVLLAPAPDAGTHAEATRAALENLARTLSIEWARHGIRITAIAPAARTTPDEVAGLVAYLASPAGDYFSGCLFALSSIDSS